MDGEVIIMVSIVLGYYIYFLIQVDGLGFIKIILMKNLQVEIVKVNVEEMGGFVVEIDFYFVVNDLVFGILVEQYEGVVIFLVFIWLISVDNIEDFEFELIVDGQVCND